MISAAAAVHVLGLLSTAPQGATLDLDVARTKLRNLDQLRQTTCGSPFALVDASLGVCRAIPGPQGVDMLPADAATLREAAFAFDFTGGGDFGQHLFDIELWDDALGEMARAVTCGDDPGIDAAWLAQETAAAVSAAAHFVMLPDAEKHGVVNLLEASVNSNAFLDARHAALSRIRERRHTVDGSGERSGMVGTNGEGVEAFFAAARERRRKQDYVAVAATENDDARVIEALYACTIDILGSAVLRPLGFPESKLGLRCFIGATRRCGSQRAVAILGTIWHAARERAPLIVQRLSPYSVAPTVSSLAQGPSTLVIVFSSLGWNGVVRAEYGATLKTVGDASSLVVAHALDTAQSWFQTSPESGEWDGGAWWDRRLEDLCTEYDRVCILGESMGATGALRFARHATESVVALVPQIDVRDFSYSGRADFSEARKEQLVNAIQAACRETTAERIVLHVGQDPPDLRQLDYLPAMGLDTRASNRLRIVRHPVPGHALGAGLKEQGLLKKTILRDLLGHTYALPATGETSAAAAQS